MVFLGNQRHVLFLVQGEPIEGHRLALRLSLRDEADIVDPLPARGITISVYVRVEYVGIKLPMRGS